MTKINASILRTSPNAIGISFGNQTLMIPKELYLDYADFLLEDSLPISLCIFIGFRNSEEGDSK